MLLAYLCVLQCRDLKVTRGYNHQVVTIGYTDSATYTGTVFYGEAARRRMATDADDLGQRLPSGSMWAWAFKAIAKINSKSWEVVGSDVQRGWKAVVALEGTYCLAGTTSAALWMARALVRLACEHGLLSRDDVPGDVQEECQVQPAVETPEASADKGDQDETMKPIGEDEEAGKGLSTSKDSAQGSGKGQDKGKGAGNGKAAGTSKGQGDGEDKGQDTSLSKGTDAQGSGKGEDHGKGAGAGEGAGEGGAAGTSKGQGDGALKKAKDPERKSSREKKQKTLYNCVQLGGLPDDRPARGVQESDTEAAVSKHSAPSPGQQELGQGMPQQSKSVVGLLCPSFCFNITVQVPI